MKVVLVVVFCDDGGCQRQPDFKSAVEFEGGQCVSGAARAGVSGRGERKITDGGRTRGDACGQGTHPCTLGTWVRYHGGGGLECAMLAFGVTRRQGRRASQVGQQETVMQEPG